MEWVSTTGIWMGDIEVGENNTAVMGELFVYDKDNIEEAAALINSLGQ